MTQVKRYEAALMEQKLILMLNYLLNDLLMLHDCWSVNANEGKRGSKMDLVIWSGSTHRIFHFICHKHKEKLPF